MRTRRRRVLNALQDAQRRTDGWCCARRLTHPQVGGNRAAARIHELRKQGHAIESRPCRCSQCRYFQDNARNRGERPTVLFAYRLIEARKDIA